MKTNPDIIKSANISFNVFNKTIKEYKLIRHRFFEYTEYMGYNVKPHIRSFYVDLIVTYSDGTQNGIKLFVAGKIFKNILEHTINDIYIEGFLTDKISFKIDSIEIGYNNNILFEIQEEVLQYMIDHQEKK